jgi:D-alanyl-D-alanine carboxypeptidase/D-alanyl-D-alanine-endopeptidase (penicillin-binding protein 4)
VTRLVRTLTVVVGILIAAGGGTFALVAATAGINHPRAVVTSGSVPTTTDAVTTTVETTTTTLPLTTTTTRAVPTTTGATVITAPKPPPVPLSPLSALTARLNAALSGANSCLRVEDPGGQVLYQYRAGAPLLPASTQKLLVAEAALATLGPDYRFTTKVEAPAAPAKGQVAELWLVGGGDPLLATPEFIPSTAGKPRTAGYPWTSLAGVASSVAAAGITSVPGGIRGDDSFEDRLRYLPVWPASYGAELQIGRLSALSVNEGLQYTPPTSTLAQDPPAYAASELARLLVKDGVAAGGGPDELAPAGAIVVATVQSAPLSQIVEAMLRGSDNWIAELVTRAIDKAGGGAGTTAGGVAIVEQRAVAAGIPMTGIHMDDGSGLSRGDLATCQELLAALDLGGQAAYSAVVAGLPVAAQTGTLATRYQGTAIAGRLQAKTGTLTGVEGMVGIETAGAPVHFALLDNSGQSGAALEAREDRVVDALAEYRG